MHPFHVLLRGLVQGAVLRGLVQGAVRIATEIASKMIPEWCITFEAELVLFSETIEDCLRVSRVEHESRPVAVVRLAMD